jgi:CHAD domain-containing protein
MNRSSVVSDESFARQMLQGHIESFLSELQSLKRRMRQEWIHSTRVHSRRTRAALEAFDDLFPSSPWRALHEQVRRITRQLGKLREREVSLTILRDLTSGGDMAENLCREYLELRLRRKQQLIRERTRVSLQSVALPRLRAHAERLFAPPKRATARGRRSTSRGLSFELRTDPIDRAQRVVAARGEPIVAFQQSRRFRRASDDQLHALRIAAKKLRYAMELFDVIWPGGLKVQIAQARAVQDSIGRFHDLAVLGNRVQRETRRAQSNEASHLAFQLGRMLASIEERKAILRRTILPPLRQLEKSLVALGQPISTDGASDRRKAEEDVPAEAEKSPRTRRKN